MFASFFSQADNVFAQSRQARIRRDCCSLRFAAFASLMLVLPACRKAEKNPDETPEARVDGDRVILKEHSPKQASLAIEPVKPAGANVLTVNGRLVWDESTTVSVFSPVAGRVSSISAELGEEIQKDEVLVTIFSPDFGQAQADASKADADFKLSKRTQERTQDLLKHGAAAQKDLEAAQDDFDNKQSELKRAVARLELYGGKLGSINGLYPLQAPIGGKLVEKHINPGQEVRPDQMLANLAQYTNPLFVISNPTKLSVLLDVTELDLEKLKADQPIAIRSRAYPEREFIGKLQVIGSALDPQTRTIFARGFVENPGGLLKAEMYVSVDIDLGLASDPEAIAGSPDDPKSPELKASPRARVEVPVKAVFSKENHHYVFLEKAPGEYQRQSVEVAGEHNGQISVVAGLTAGQRVVTDGCLLLESLTEGAGKD